MMNSEGVAAMVTDLTGDGVDAQRHLPGEVPCMIHDEQTGSAQKNRPDLFSDSLKHAKALMDRYVCN